MLKFSSKIFFLLYVVDITSSFNINLEIKRELPSSVSLSEIIEEFYIRNALDLDIITCSNDGEGTNSIVEFILRNIHGSISYRIEDCKNLKDSTKRRFVLIIMDHLNTDLMIEELTPNRFDYSGFYLIYYIDNQSDNDILHYLFKKLSDLFIYNVNVICNDSSGIQLRTFFFFNEGSCNSTDPVVINKFENNRWISKDFFPRKMRNLFGCPLKVATFIYEPAVIMQGSYDDNNYTLVGSEVEILKEIANVLNFSIEYSFDPSPGAWGFIKPNGEAVGVIPPGAPFSAFEKLIRPFDKSVWICLMIILSLGFFIVIAVALKSRSLMRRIIIGKEVKMPAMNIIVALVGGSQHILPKRSTPRMLLMSFLLFCLVIRTLYTTALFKFLQSDSRKSPVSSIDELIAKNFTVYHYASMEETLRHLNIKKLLQLVNVTEFSSYQERTFDPEFKGAVVSLMDQILYLNKKNYKKNYFRVLNEVVYTSLSSWVFPKNSFLVEMFDENIQKFRENGLLYYMTNDFIDLRYLNIKEPKQGPRKLNLERLLGGFQLWFLGISIAFLIFLLEALCGYSKTFLKERKNQLYVSHLAKER
ncbi:CLUMA_CG004581, isoform A [Clunio marinus]|uniref:CLUMA_CG004581, isoform A n=1 Tax=Clunio marinus TaxID=568069 RepID=A0A1J1HU47_9DIPT|nr:CLUMA_CG004581, isoform A [Clunio marinus]